MATIWKRSSQGWCLLLLWLVTVGGCTTLGKTCQCSTPVPSETVRPRVVFVSPQGKKIVVDVEVACTDKDRQTGLMYRKKLGKNKGMLFVFPYQRVQSFWMKNTYIPLDMIHVNKKKEVVGIVENATPHTLDSRQVGQPALFVVEVNAFFARKHGIHREWKTQMLDVALKDCDSSGEN